MYYPYFRGRQYELVTVRENAPLLKQAGFVPIIEPVQESLSGLKRTLLALKEVDAEVVLIANPFHGNHAHDASDLHELLDSELKDYSNISVGIALRQSMSAAAAAELHAAYQGRPLTFIHAGFIPAGDLVSAVGQQIRSARHIFFEECCGKLYRKHFQDAQRILLRDGFKKQRTNRDYPELEPFSDLHATFTDEGMQGFGDFLMVGDDYAESGGPAYAVAIHLTFIDPDKDGAMFVHHFKSVRHDTPTDPGGKFAEALQKLVIEVNRPGSPIAHTSAVSEFMNLHERRHFPGLGYVKKLSMTHHIETLASYFRKS